MKHALGIAVNLISGGTSGLWDGAAAFKLSQGSSARAGIMAAKLARARMTGISDPFGKKNSYFAVFSKSGIVSPEIMTQDLGKKFRIRLSGSRCIPAAGLLRPLPRPLLSLPPNTILKVRIFRGHGAFLSGACGPFHYLRPYKVGDYPPPTLFSATGIPSLTG